MRRFKDQNRARLHPPFSLRDLRGVALALIRSPGHSSPDTARFILSTTPRAQLAVSCVYRFTVSP